MALFVTPQKQQLYINNVSKSCEASNDCEIS